MCDWSCAHAVECNWYESMLVEWLYVHMWLNANKMMQKCIACTSWVSAWPQATTLCDYEDRWFMHPSQKPCSSSVPLMWSGCMTWSSGVYVCGVGVPSAVSLMSPVVLFSVSISAATLASSPGLPLLLLYNNAGGMEEWKVFHIRQAHIILGERGRGRPGNEATVTPQTEVQFHTLIYMQSG